MVLLYNELFVVFLIIMMIVGPNAAKSCDDFEILNKELVLSK